MEKSKYAHNNPKTTPIFKIVPNSITYYILHIVFKFHLGRIYILKIIHDFQILPVKICTAKKNMSLSPYTGIHYPLSPYTGIHYPLSPYTGIHYPLFPYTGIHKWAGKPYECY